MWARGECGPSARWRLSSGLAAPASRCAPHSEASEGEMLIEMSCGLCGRIQEVRDHQSYLAALAKTRTSLHRFASSNHSASFRHHHCCNDSSCSMRTVARRAPRIVSPLLLAHSLAAALRPAALRPAAPRHIPPRATMKFADFLAIREKAAKKRTPEEIAKEYPQSVR
jgi:hypothetical protein